MNNFWGYVVVTASGWISLAVIYHSYVKLKIAKTYGVYIRQAIETTMAKRINELGKDYFEGCGKYGDS